MQLSLHFYENLGQIMLILETFPRVLTPKTVPSIGSIKLYSRTKYYRDLNIFPTISCQYIAAVCGSISYLETTYLVLVHVDSELQRQHLFVGY
jgi:hypothetical protein